MLQPNTLVAKIIALSILGIVLLASNQFVLQPLLDIHQKNNETITRSNELMQRYRSLVAEQPILAERLETLQSEDAAGAIYLEGASDPLVAAELQNLTSETIEIAGGEIKSVQTLSAVNVGEDTALRKAAVNLHFSTDIDGLAEALFNLETGDPLLFINRLQVSVDGNGQANENVTLVPKLDVRLDIFGFVRRLE